MEKPEYYLSDALRFFEGHSLEQSLYEALYLRMEAAFPEASVKVQKTQISFYERHLFAAVSLPLRRRKDWPKHCILVTFGLPIRVASPRIAVATEPYPNRWTHHVVVARAEEIDEELMGWLEEARRFAAHKR